jgi:hypothetical protein
MINTCIRKSNGKYYVKVQPRRLTVRFLSSTFRLRCAAHPSKHPFKKTSGKGTEFFQINKQMLKYWLILFLRRCKKITANDVKKCATKIWLYCHRAGDYI